MEHDSRDPTTSWAPRVLLLRSLLPFAVLLLVTSTIWIGPFGLLLAATGWWHIVKRIR